MLDKIQTFVVKTREQTQKPGLHIGQITSLFVQQLSYFLINTNTYPRHRTLLNIEVKQ